jgi:hypothetical protein
MNAIEVIISLRDISQVSLERSVTVHAPVGVPVVVRFEEED